MAQVDYEYQAREYLKGTQYKSGAVIAVSVPNKSKTERHTFCFRNKEGVWIREDLPDLETALQSQITEA